MEAVHVDERGPTMLTFSGRLVHPFDLSPNDIDIEDIASSLSCLNRYCGHTKYPYSVAQHSVIVSLLVPPSLAWYGLMHDTPEAYLGDMIAPVKRMIGAELEVADARAWAAICEKFSHTCQHPPEVHALDKRLRCNEQLVTMRVPKHWREKLEAEAIRDERIQGWLREMSYGDAQAWFMKRFNQLQQGGG